MKRTLFALAVVACAIGAYVALVHHLFTPREVVQKAETPPPICVDGLDLPLADEMVEAPVEGPPGYYTEAEPVEANEKGAPDPGHGALPRGEPDVGQPSSTPVFSVDEPVRAFGHGTYSRRSRAGSRSAPRDEEQELLPSDPNEELWVIARNDDAAPAGPRYDTPGSGALVAKLPDKKDKVPVPLKHTDVKARISGMVATVDVTQQFHNPYNVKIEASYVFPLPQNAAVNEFAMTVGERRIRGLIREREQAKRIYREARSRGQVASLLTQERPNIFTQKVANIEPGKAIDVNIRYFNTLAYVDGWVEFVFPMVVGPRFNPPGTSDGVGAVARGRHGASGQATEVQYLRPDERSGHDIALAVDLDAGVAIEEIASTNHVVKTARPAPERATVTLSQLDSVPNKDFVLRYRVAGEKIKSAVMAHRDDRGAYFTLLLLPPKAVEHVERSPMELIFVLDCSGSMRGRPMEQAKRAAERGLRSLRPGDTFQIIRFSNSASKLGSEPLPATKDNVERGLAYLASLHGSGGTQMIEGIKAALEFRHEPKQFRYVVFLTDGYIGNENEILAAVHKRIGGSRIFSFGVGSSTNRYLLDRMARVGRGCVAFLSLNDSAAAVMDRFFTRVSHPAITDVTVDWGDMQAADVYPRRIPDLFVGRPVILTGRFKGRGRATVRVKGRIGGVMRRRDIAVDLGDRTDHPGLSSLWARAKIADLSAQAIQTPKPELHEQIKLVALEYSLMSAYTAFVAVDTESRTAGDHGVTVAVPVPVPEGVRYDTTVHE